MSNATTLAAVVRPLIEPGWQPGYHRLKETLAQLPEPRSEKDSRFIDLPPVYLVGNLEALEAGKFVLFTGLNPNGDERHRRALETDFDSYWRWCMTYFSEEGDTSDHYRVHAAFLRGLSESPRIPGGTLADQAVAVDLCGLASTSGWPKKQIRLTATRRTARVKRPELPDLRNDRKYPTFGFSARVFEALAPHAVCVVARYKGTYEALQSYYPADDDLIEVDSKKIPLFCIPDAPYRPSPRKAFELGRDAAERLGRLLPLAE